MSTATALRTTEELLALPDDGVDRWLIAGQLREQPGRVGLREPPVTKRDRFHSQTLMSIGIELGNWLRQQPLPQEALLGGEAGVRLLRDPDTTVGVDVAYVSAEVMSRQTDESTIIEGVPVLAGEILSPTTTLEQINEKIHAHLGAGVSLVWIVDIDLRTGTVHRRSRSELFDIRQEITAEPELPGFRAPVARFFE